ncbi:hypothetical protein, partial [Bombella pollinis]
IERLQKAFREDRKGTIKKLVKAGVLRGWAENAADLVLSQKGRYGPCAIIMGGLLDNMGYEWGDVLHHARAINVETYYGMGPQWAVCDSRNMEVDADVGQLAW